MIEADPPKDFGGGRRSRSAIDSIQEIADTDLACASLRSRELLCGTYRPAWRVMSCAVACGVSLQMSSLLRDEICVSVAKSRGNLAREMHNDP
jgi:hypothetical protein